MSTSIRMPQRSIALAAGCAIACAGAFAVAQQADVARAESGYRAASPSERAQMNAALNAAHVHMARRGPFRVVRNGARWGYVCGSGQNDRYALIAPAHFAALRKVNGHWRFRTVHELSSGESQYMWLKCG